MYIKADSHRSMKSQFRHSTAIVIMILPARRNRRQRYFCRITNTAVKADLHILVTVPATHPHRSVSECYNEQQCFNSHISFNFKADSHVWFGPKVYRQLKNNEEQFYTESRTSEYRNMIPLTRLCLVSTRGTNEFRANAVREFLLFQLYLSIKLSQWFEWKINLTAILYKYTFS